MVDEQAVTMVASLADAKADGTADTRAAVMAAAMAVLLDSMSVVSKEAMLVEKKDSR